MVSTGLVIGALACQNNWVGGPGVLGPVSDWSTEYWIGDSERVPFRL